MQVNDIKDLDVILVGSGMGSAAAAALLMLAIGPIWPE